PILRRRQHRSTKIQSWYRMLAPWRAYRRLRSATVALQCRTRQKIAYAELKDLRIKAKDVGKLKRDNERLKAELRQAASRAAAASDERVRNANSLRDEVRRLNARVAELEVEVVEGARAARR
ncbi:unnamed protein product, partial [Hapterophycus canaliculatus]